MAELVGDQFADIDRSGFEIKGRQRLRRNYVAEVSEYRAKLGQAQPVAEE